MARFLPFLGQQRGPAKLRITGTPPALTVGEAFSFTYVIVGGVEPYDVTGSGTLPDGVTHNATTLTFSGTPSVAGDFNYDVNVEDADGRTASATFHLSVADVTPEPGDLSITGTPPDAVEGDEYFWTPGVTGGVGPYVLTAIDLPDGLMVDDGNVVGIPVAAGEGLTFHLRVTDANDDTADLETVINVEPQEPDVFRLVGEPQDGIAGAPYGQPTSIGEPLFLLTLENASPGEIEYSFIPDDGYGELSDYGLGFATQTFLGVFTPAADGDTLIDFSGGDLRGTIRATNTTTSETADLPFIMNIRPPLSTFTQNFASGENVPAQYVQPVNSFLSESGHSVTMANAVFAWNGKSESTTPKGIFPSQFNGVMRIDGFSTPSGDQEVVWVAGMRHLGASDTTYLGAVLRASAGFSHSSGAYYCGYYYSNPATSTYEFRIARRSGSEWVDIGAPYVRELTFGETPVRVRFTAEDDDVNENVKLALIIDGAPRIETTDDTLYGQNGMMGVVWRGGGSGPNYNPRLMELYAGTLGEVDAPEPETTYFIDYENGDDENDGLTEATAWKHGPRWPGSTGRAAMYDPLPGDTYKFRGGVEYGGRVAIMRGSADPDKPVSYVGNDWGAKRAAIRNGSEVLSLLRRATVGDSEVPQEIREHPDFWILEHPDILTGFAPVIYDDVNGIYDLASYPKPMRTADIENIYTGGFFYTPATTPGVRERVEIGSAHYNKITDAALADALRGSNNLSGIALSRGSQNLLYPVNYYVEGNDVFARSVSVGLTNDYDEPGNSGFRLAFYNIITGIAEGGACPLGAGKLGIMLRPGATTLKLVKWVYSNNLNESMRQQISVRDNARVDGFTFQGFAGRGIFDVSGGSNVEITRNLIADATNRVSSRQIFIDARKSKNVNIHHNTFARINNLDLVRIHESEDFSLDDNVGYAGASIIVNQNSGGPAKVLRVRIRRNIFRDGINTHKNALTFYCNNNQTGVLYQTDDVLIEDNCIIEMGFPYKMRGWWSNFVLRGNIFQGVSDTNGAFWQSDSPYNLPNLDGQPPIASNMTVEDCGFFNPAPAANIRMSRGNHNVNITNTIAQRLVFDSVASGKADYRDEWVVDTINESWETYLQRPNVNLDDLFHVIYETADGRIIELDHRGHPTDE